MDQMEEQHRVKNKKHTILSKSQSGQATAITRTDPISTA
jgi:hypothetical protein